MRERATLFTISMVAIVAILLAVYRQQAVRKELEGLRDDKRQLSESEATLTARVREADRTIAQLREESQGLKAANAGAVESASVDAILAKVDGVQKKLDSATETLDDLRSAVRDPEAGVLTRLESISKSIEPAKQLPRRVTELSKQIGDVSLQVAALAEGFDEHTKQIGGDRELGARDVARVGTEGATPSPGASGYVQGPVPEPPLLETTLKAAKDGFVVLAAGRKDGLAHGQIFYVTRQGKPQGRVQVVNVYDHLAGGRVLELLPGRALRPGDAASTLEPLAWEHLQPRSSSPASATTESVGEESSTPSNSPVAPHLGSSNPIPPPPPAPPGG